MANLESDEAMKPLLGKKLKQWSDKAFNAGKEIEAMKRLTLHRFYCPALSTYNLRRNGWHVVHRDGT